MWTPMGDPQKKQILKYVVDQTDTSVVAALFLSNATTKEHLQESVLPAA